MISKPLYKQSAKANLGTWVFVTAINCIMLAIIIIVLGRLSVSEIRDSMADMFIRDAIESNIEQKSMEYYNLTDKTLINYEENFNNIYDLLNVRLNTFQKNYIINTYKNLLQQGYTDEEARQVLTNNQPAEYQLAINTFLNYYLVQGEDYSREKVSEYILNLIAEELYKQVLETDGEEAAQTAKVFISVAINAYVSSGSTNVTEFATNYIPSVLQDVFHEQSFTNKNKTINVSDYFTKARIYELSYSAIVSFRAELEVKENQLREKYPDYTDEQIQSELEKQVTSIIQERSKTLLDSLPKKVSEALTELGDMEVSTLVIGTIFYRISGLLLPIIFVIMTANNLIAGQVDSGAMAFVLSTPTKRRKVTITQMSYLISALLVMYILMTLTSIISLSIVKDAIKITYMQLLKLNLSAFITMLAISGICFLSSCWFNRSKYAMSIGGGLTMFFLVATILGLFGSPVIPSAIRIEAMRYFNYVSIITLFDTNSIIEGTNNYLWKLLILLFIGLITYIIGIKRFNEKDLPL